MATIELDPHREPATAAPRPLQIRLLGELQVLREGQLLALPPSRKTRALLGYLLLTQRSQRRERLCELFWDVADDPRAALRWSLTKLRELLDGSAVRLQADREQVTIDTRDLTVDALTLKRLLAAGPETASTDTLRQALPLFRGELLEGLELPEFHAYHAFCMAERSELRELHRRLLSSLVSRAEDRPAELLPLLRALVQLDPLDSQRRAQLFELLQKSGRASEAERELRDRELLLSGPRQRAEPRLERSSMLALGHTPTLPFVGRKPELARLTALLARSESGVRCALLTGDPGIGKSRLLMELLQTEQARGGRVRRVAVQEARLGFPYSPFRELLQTLPSAAGVPVLEAAAEPDGAAGLDSERGREQLFRAVAKCIEASASDRPLVLAFDDIQWLDSASLSLLHFLCSELPSVRVTILLSARRGELHDQAAARRVLRALKRDGVLLEVALGPLSADEIRALVVALNSRRDPEEVLMRSAGHPLYALELSRHEQGPLPESLLSLIRDRLAALPPEPSELLRWASVLGGAFDGDVLGSLLNYSADQLVDNLEYLERHGFLQFEQGGPSTSCRFAHDVVRHALYDQLSEPRRRLMHARIARLAMEIGQLDDERAAHVAHHASLGGDQALAAQACLSAGRRCLRLFVPNEALALARRGLGHAQQLDDAQRIPVALGLLEVAIVAARPAPVELSSMLAALTTRALDLGSISDARKGFYLQALLTWEEGRLADAGRFSREAERISRSGSPADQLLGLAEAARCLVALEQELPQAEAFLLEAETLSARSQLPLPVCGNLARGMLQLYRGEYGVAEGTLELARQRARSEGERLTEFYALEGLVDLHLQQGQHEQAEALSEVLCELSERLRQGSELPLARALCALARYGRHGESSEPELSDAISLLDLADAKQRSALVLSRAAQLQLARGHFERARRNAERAFKLASAIWHNSQQHEALALLVLIDQHEPGFVSGGELQDRLALLAAAPPLSAHARSLVARACSSVRRPKDVPPRKKGARHGARDRGAKAG